MVADFDWEVDFQDKDLQVPVTLSLEDKSISATSYTWKLESAIPSVSSEQNPVIRFNTPGLKNITLTASNGKESQSITKEITLLRDTNIKSFKDLRFGINTSHSKDSIGAFFSATTEKMYSESEVDTIDGAIIDLVYFGQNSSFSFNRFYPPNELESTTFQTLPGALPTKVMNTLEDCDCTTSFSVTQFDAIVNDISIKDLKIVQNTNSFQPFNGDLSPRIVLFMTSDGRKGALKIKDFVNDGDYSYILADIKIQKQKSS